MTRKTVTDIDIVVGSSAAYYLYGMCVLSGELRRVERLFTLASLRCTHSAPCSAVSAARRGDEVDGMGVSLGL